MEERIEQMTEQKIIAILYRMEDDKSVATDEHGKSKQPSLSVKVEWSVENELLLVEWADMAQCYKWLHTEECTKFRHLHMWFTIPVITLSTVTGTASFATASVPDSIREYAPMVIGTINIFVAILGTVQQYMKISELKEAHNNSAIFWDKIARSIRTELTKLPRERIDCGHFLKSCRIDFDRFMETSPMLSHNAVTAFENNFKGELGTEKRRLYDELNKPDVCNYIISANHNRHHWWRSEITMDVKKELNRDVEAV